VSLFSKPGCSFCAKAKADLKNAGIVFEEVVLGRDANLTSLRAMTGKETVPQVFIAGKHIGGSEELAAYLKA
jgi:glutaredoxin-like protein